MCGLPADAAFLRDGKVSPVVVNALLFSLLFAAIAELALAASDEPGQQPAAIAVSPVVAAVRDASPGMPRAPNVPVVPVSPLTDHYARFLESITVPVFFH